MQNLDDIKYLEQLIILLLVCLKAKHKNQLSLIYFRYVKTLADTQSRCTFPPKAGGGGNVPLSVPLRIVYCTLSRVLYIIFFQVYIECIKVHFVHNISNVKNRVCNFVYHLKFRVCIVYLRNTKHETRNTTFSCNMYTTLLRTKLSTKRGRDSRIVYFRAPHSRWL